MHCQRSEQLGHGLSLSDSLRSSARLMRLTKSSSDSLAITEDAMTSRSLQVGHGVQVMLAQRLMINGRSCSIYKVWICACPLVC